jgi:hypothetical protein
MAVNARSSALLVLTITLALQGTSLEGQAMPPLEMRQAVGGAASPPVRLAERQRLEPIAELGVASATAADELAALAAWNRDRLPIKNGFTRPLLEPRRIEIGAASQRSQVSGREATATDPSGNQIWAAEVRVQGAHRQRLHLANLNLPPSARLWVYGEGDEWAGPFGLELVNDEGLWTPSIGGERIRLEVSIAAGDAASAVWSFTIDSVLEIFELDNAGRPIATAVGLDQRDEDCLIDARCIGPGTFGSIDLVRRAIGYMEFVDDGDSSQCTGGLLNNGGTPTALFFLTANHCLADQNAASTVEVFWDYTSSVCSGTPPSLGSLPRSLGSRLRASHQATDVTLLELFSIPANRIFLGWDGSPNAALPGTVLHRVAHPAGFQQVYSRAVAQIREPICNRRPVTNYIYSTPVAGTTLGGSSGSPVIKEGAIVVGQLFGKCLSNDDACSAANNQIDGALSKTLDFGVGFLLTGTAFPPCQAGPSVMCLQNGRFRLNVDWASENRSGAGTVVPAGTVDSGLFWFFNSTNWEMLVKTLNACIPAFNHYWVFYAATTNVQFELTAIDLAKRNVRGYFNAQGEAADPIQDIFAFATCP